MKISITAIIIVLIILFFSNRISNKLDQDKLMYEKVLGTELIIGYEHYIVTDYNYMKKTFTLNHVKEVEIYFFHKHKSCIKQKTASYDSFFL